MASIDGRMLVLAARAAERSMLRCRVGAVNDCYGSGYNRKQTHPQIERYGYPPHSDIHAELDLALQGEWAITGRTIYVTRLTRNGGWALAKPCPACMGVLAYLEAKRVVWTIKPGSWDYLTL